MKKVIGLILLTMLACVPSYALQVFEDNVEKGHVSALNLSDGLNMTRAGSTGTIEAEYKTYVAFDAVASGQTSKAVTVTGITTAARCVVTAAEVATNAVYVRAAVVTANTVTVTTSGDPGASNLDVAVVCFE